MAIRMVAVALLLLSGCDLRPLTELGDGGTDGAVDLPRAEAGDLPVWPDMSGPGCPGGPFTESVDPGEKGGRYSALGVHRASGTLHVVHHRKTPGDDVLHSTRPGGSTSWATAPILTAGDVGGHATIAVAPDGTVHAVFADLTGGTLVHGRDDGSGWSTAPITDTRPVACDLAVDQAGFVHLLAQNGKGTELVYLRHDPAGSGWEPAVTVETSLPFFDRRQAIGVSGQGAVHVVHGDAQGRLLYRSASAGVFSAGQPLASGLDDLGADLVVDPDGDVHVIYNDKDAGELRYVGQEAGSFGPSESLGPVSAMAQSYLADHAAIVAGAGDTLWVVYGDSSATLTVRRRTGGTWGPPVRPGACCGSNLSAAVDAAGVLHISHWTAATDELRYTRVCP